MSDETAFRAALKADPTDRTTRLVFADWLDEHDRAREAALQRVLAVPESDELRSSDEPLTETKRRQASVLFLRLTEALVELSK